MRDFWSAIVGVKLHEKSDPREESTMDGTLQALQQWYAKQCNGDWEHSWGVEISTLDNPGWSVKINLVEMALERRPFETITVPDDASTFERSDRWLRCFVVDGVWHGVGDESKLATILETFLAWAG